MGYSRDVYVSARNRLECIRVKNAKDYETRRKKFRLKYANGARIEDEMAKTSISVARLLISGNKSVEKVKKLKDKNVALAKEFRDFLRESGLPEDYLKPRYNCDVCLDTGYVGGIMCNCFKKILRNETYNSLNRLSPLSLCNFDSFDLSYYDPKIKADPKSSRQTTQREKMQKIYIFCKNYVKEFSADSSNILMMGGTGLGKTHLSLAIANEIINSGFGVIYVSVPNIICKLESERYRYAGKNTQEILFDCDLLILDDLGTEYRTQFSNSAIYNIINSRILCSKATIISTNCTMEAIESDYSKRLISRLWGEYKLLHFCGTDVRAQKAVRKEHGSRI